jgi:hypothetical protein
VWMCPSQKPILFHREIAEDLEAGLQQFAEIAADLKK